MIKGTGIASLYMAKYVNYDESIKKKAWYIYLRVYKVYHCFPYTFNSCIYLELK